MKPQSEPSARGEVSEPTPPADQPHDLTALLVAWGAGDQTALDALIPHVYLELRRQAELAMHRERPGHTLQATALVHEVYLRLAGQKRIHWQNRAQFFGVASQLMRRILVDHARGKLAAKRGGSGNLEAMTSTEADALAAAVPAEPDGASATDVLALDEALTSLATLDPQQARIAELRFFAGLSIEETAAAVGVSPATVKREWRVTRAWLRRALDERNTP